MGSVVRGAKMCILTSVKCVPMLLFLLPKSVSDRAFLWYIPNNSYWCPCSWWNVILCSTHFSCHSSRVSVRFFCTSVSGYSFTSSEVLLSAIVSQVPLLYKQMSLMPKWKIFAMLTFKGTAILLKNEIKTILLRSMVLKK